MSPDARKLLDEALSLPLPARAALAGSLLDSLDPHVDDDVEEAWSRELARRVEALDAGVARTIPWSELRRRLLGDTGAPRA